MRAALFVPLLAACGLAEPAPLSEHSFAFGVFGDGPYYRWDRTRFDRLLADVNRHELAFFLHVGDLFERPCSDAMYRERLAELNTIRHPVVYTPGDNDWTDCHMARGGRHDPLERLAALRGIFFSDPRQSLGGARMPLETQADDSAFAAFREHARWERGGVVFLTVHMVGSDNGLDPWDGIGPEHAAEVMERSRAAVHWLEAGFARAREANLRALVVAFHGEPGLARGADRVGGYDALMDALVNEARVFPGQVLLIHGDWHEYHVDRPVRDRATGRVVPNVTRLQTFGSPDIGWVRVVVDTVSGRFLAFEPRLMPLHWVLRRN